MTGLFSIHSQEYNLVLDPGKRNKGVHNICRMNQETLKREISSQASQKSTLASTVIRVMSHVDFVKSVEIPHKLLMQHTDTEPMANRNERK